MWFSIVVRATARLDPGKMRVMGSRWKNTEAAKGSVTATEVD